MTWPSYGSTREEAESGFKSLSSQAIALKPNYAEAQT